MAILRAECMSSKRKWTCDRTDLPFSSTNRSAALSLRPSENLQGILPWQLRSLLPPYDLKFPSFLWSDLAISENHVRRLD